jgi:hypothetical protein
VERRYIFGLTYDNSEQESCAIAGMRRVRKLRCLLVDEEILKSFEQMIPEEQWEPRWCSKVCEIFEKELLWGGLPLVMSDDAYKLRFYVLREMAKLYHNGSTTEDQRGGRTWAHCLHDVALVVPASGANK